MKYWKESRYLLDEDDTKKDENAADAANCRFAAIPRGRSATTMMTPPLASLFVRSCDFKSEQLALRQMLNF